LPEFADAEEFCCIAATAVILAGHGFPRRRPPSQKIQKIVMRRSFPRRRPPASSALVHRKQGYTMNTQPRTMPGIVGYISILLIVASFIGPALI